MLALLPEELTSKAFAAVFLPTGCEEVLVRGAITSEKVWVHAVVKKVDSQALAIECNVVIAHFETKQVLVQLNHFRMQLARGFSRTNPVTRALYSLQWLPNDSISRSRGDVEEREEAWLLLTSGARGSLDKAAKESLPISVTLTEREVRSIDDSTLASEAPAGWGRVVCTLFGGKQQSPSQEAQTLLLLLQQLLRRPAPLMVLVQDTLSGGEGWRHHWVYGMIRTARIEHPSLAITVVDVGSECLPKCWTIASLGQDVWVRDGRYLTPHLAPSADAHLPFSFDLIARGSIEGGLKRRDVLPSERDTALQDREIEICVKAVGLNFRDVLNVLDLYPGDPGLPGIELSGVVTRASRKSRFQVGDKVYGFPDKGCFRSHVTTSDVCLANMPSNRTFDDMAALPIAWLTVVHAFEQLAGLKRGEKVLIHAASGGVGLVAVQIAQRIGAEIYATAGSEEKHAYLRGLGVKHIASSRDAEAFKASMGAAKVDVVLNCLSDNFIPYSLELLTKNGRFMEIGKRGVWTREAMKAARPDVLYDRIALDSMIADDFKAKKQGWAFAGLEQLTADSEAGRAEALPVKTFDLRDELAETMNFLRTAKHIGKVVLSSPECGIPVVRDGTYVISGGLGALGLATAKHLADKGARHLVLLSRGGKVKADSQALWEELLNVPGGVSTRAVSCDVSSAQSLGKALGTALSSMPPVRGVIHAAGVLDDRLLVDQTPESIEEVFKPKVEGAWNLHELSLQLAWPLDFFVSYTSMAGVLGNAGQANYAAANAAVDGLMQHRRRLGYSSSVALQWGPWAEAGMAARSEAAMASLEMAGVGLISKALGMAALDAGVSAPSAASRELLVLPGMDWPAFSETASNPGMLDALVREASMVGPQNKASNSVTTEVKRDLLELSEGERKPMLQALIMEMAKACIGEAGIELDALRPLMEAGLDSMSTVELRSRLQARFGVPVPNDVLFSYPSVAALTEWLEGLVLGAEEGEDEDRNAEPAGGSMTAPLAIVGMACRLPGGSNSPEEFWAMLSNGKDCVQPAPLDRWASKEEDEQQWQGSFIDGVEMFDTSVFGISSAEASAMDPHQRVMLEVGLDALVTAGCTKQSLRGSQTGVFVGMSGSDWGALGEGSSSTGAYSTMGAAGASVSNRLSYTLGLQGPSMTTDTACSSSLVALDSACSSLRMGKCDAAVVGGVNLLLGTQSFERLKGSGFLSPDWRCKTFDASANGYVRGEGFGAVVLKRLDGALAVGDTVLAVIEGCAVNHNGASARLTAPSPAAQQRLIETTLREAGREGSEVRIVESHGTGTSLGDPIEMSALRATYGKNREDSFPLVVGAVKTNIGHLEGAAGIAGIIKAVLMLQHRAVPANLHLESINPELDMDGFPVQLPSAMVQLEDEGDVLVGVSSFGAGGANAHVLLRSYGEKRGDLAPAVHVYQAQTPVAFLFTGQGSQYVGMGRELYEKEGVFRECVRRCSRLLMERAWLDKSVVELMYPTAAEDGEEEEEKTAQAALLKETRYCQPCLFVLEYALCELWKSEGVEPSMVMGHSLGEVVAACVAGVMSLEDGLMLSAKRGAAMQACPEGEGVMFAVRAGKEATLASIDAAGGAGEVVLASSNGPRASVMSGARSAVDKVVEKLAADGVGCKALEVSHAFHSPLMEPAVRTLEEVLRQVSFNAPRIPLVSNVTGEVAREEEVTQATYWVQHMLSPVLFAEGIHTLVEHWMGDGRGADLSIIEVGPNLVLSNMGAKCERREGLVWVSSVTREKSSEDSFGAALCTVQQQKSKGKEHILFPTRKAFPWYTARATAAPQTRSEAEQGPLYVVEWETVEVPTASQRASLTSSLPWLVVIPKAAEGHHASSNHRALEGIRSAATASGVEVHMVEAVGSDAQPHGAHLFYLASGTCSATDGAIHFVQTVQSLDGDEAVMPITVVTTGVYSGASWQDSWAAGLVRSIRLERGDLAVNHVDLECAMSPQSEDAQPGVEEREDQTVSQAVTLAAEAQDGGRGVDLLVRGCEILAPRLVPSTLHLTSAGVDRFACREDGTYLISGGLGGLGLVTANHLVSQGARHLLLLSRSGRAAEEVSELWQALQSMENVTAVAVACDVSNMSQLRDAVATALVGLPHVRGVIHAAGVIGARGMLSVETEENVRNVFAAKIQGGWNLHALCLEWAASGREEVDFFASYSSTSALLGLSNQSANAGANAALDGLMRYRRHQLGLPASNVHWGPWGDVGTAVRLEMVSKAAEMAGVGLISSALGMKALGAILASHVQANVQEVAIMPAMRWGKFRASLDPVHSDFLGQLTDRRGSGDASKGYSVNAEVREELLHLPESARRERIEQVLTDTAVQCVGEDFTLAATMPLMEAGLDSMASVEFRSRIEAWCGVPVSNGAFFSYPSVSAMAAWLEAQILEMPRDTEREEVLIRQHFSSDSRAPIAVVSMACRLPGGANSPEQFWSLMCEGRDCITAAPHDRWESKKGEVQLQGGFIEGVEMFDNAFFGISAAEAQAMDPNQRLMLEVAFEALHRAGHSKSSLRGSNTGVFVGLSDTDWGFVAGDTAQSAYGGMGMTASNIANRVSYTLGLCGPSTLLQTACSSSLVALDAACSNLRLGKCDSAVVGGVNLLLGKSTFQSLIAGTFLSPDWRCKTFDASANGYVRGEGCGAIVLKHLDDAVASGNTVLAVIEGCAVNHNGASARLTAPSPLAQQQLLSAALAEAERDPADVSFVEAHGTGTALGDPIEISALKAVYCGPDRSEGNALVVGALKANIGHLEGAAGIAGLIKTVLVLQHRAAPPNLHLKNINPELELAGVPVTLPVTMEPVGRGGWTGPLVAAVSSFGAGGTNAHAVLSGPRAGSTATHADGEGVSLIDALPKDDECERGDLYPTRQAFRWFRPPLAFMPSGEVVQEGDGMRLASPFSPHLKDLLKDHAVNNVVIIPGVTYIEVGVVVALGGRQLGVEQEVVLRGASFVVPLEIEGFQQAGTDHAQSRHPMVCAGMSALHTADASMQFFGGATGDKGTTARMKHVSVLERSTARASLHVESIRARVGEQDVSSELYKSFADAGFQYGPRFQRTRHMYGGDGEVLSAVCAMDEELCEPWEMKGFALHPAVLDNATHAIMQALPRKLLKEGGSSPFLPAGFDEVIVSASMTGKNVWVHTKLTEVQSVAGSVKVDIRIADFDCKEVLVEMRGFRVQRARGFVRASPVRRAMYALEWQAAEPSTQEEAPGSDTDPAEAAPPQKWLVVIPQDEREGETAIMAVVRRCVPQNVHVHTRYGGVDVSGDDDALLLGEDEWARVLYVLIPGAGEEDAEGGQQARAAYALMALLRSLSTTSNMPLTVLTRGVDSGEDWRHSWVAGLVRTARMEHPYMQIRVVDLSDKEASDSEVALGLAFPGTTEDVWVRDGQCWMPRLARPALNLPFSLELRARGSIANAFLLRDDVDVGKHELLDPAGSIVEVAVRAVGLNFRDVLNVLGMYPGDPGDPCSEFAGEVIRVGGSSRFRVGDAVFGFADGGCLRSHMTTSDACLAVMPAVLSFEQAAALPTVCLTVVKAFHDLKAGEKVLIHAASGGVGLAAVQYAQRVGAEVYATAGAAVKHDFLRSLGVEHIASSRDAEAFKLSMGEVKVDVVLNSLSDDYIPFSLAMLSEGGTFVEIGKRGVWNHDQMRTARPDVRYNLVAVGAIIDVDFSAGEPGWISDELQHLAEDCMSGNVKPLPTIPFDMREDTQKAMVLMSQAKHIGKVVLTNPLYGVPVVSDGTYVISGGLGALGLVTAQHLASRGARHLVLLSRSGKVAESMTEQWQQLQNKVELIHTPTCDVADAEALRTCLGGVLPLLPPVRGVVHAAGVLDDKLMGEQTAESVTNVFRPKVQGAVNLHELSLSWSREEDHASSLDFFVCFTSMAGVLGNAGQANYAAANAAVDGLMRHRRHLGLAGMSLQWGPWADVGMAAQLDIVQKQLELAGVGTVSAELGMAALDAAVMSSASSASLGDVSILPGMDWAMYGKATRGGRVHMLEGLLGDVKGDLEAGEGTSELHEELLDLPPVARQAMVVNKVKQVVEHCIGDEGGLIHDSTLLMEAGVDSLASVEIVNRLSAWVGFSLPPSISIEHPTPADIARHILGLLFPLEDNRGVGVVIKADSSDAAAVREDERREGYSALDASDADEREDGDRALDGRDADYVGSSSSDIVSFCMGIVAMVYSSLLVAASALPAVIALDSIVLDKWGRWTALACVPLAFLSWALLLMAVVTLTKWVVIGRYRAGSYPINSGYYFRWLFVDRVTDFALQRLPLHGSVVWTWWLRALGAKIGHGCRLHSVSVSEFDLVHLGRQSTVEEFCRVRPAVIEDHHLLLRQITVGADCVLGASSQVFGGTTMGEMVRLRPSTVVSGRCGPLAPCTEWGGSPAKQCDDNADRMGSSSLLPSVNDPAATLVKDVMRTVVGFALAAVCMAAASIPAYFFWGEMSKAWGLFTYVPQLGRYVPDYRSLDVGYLVAACAATFDLALVPLLPIALGFVDTLAPLKELTTEQYLAKPMLILALSYSVAGICMTAMSVALRRCLGALAAISSRSSGRGVTGQEVHAVDVMMRLVYPRSMVLHSGGPGMVIWLRSLGARVAWTAKVSAPSPVLDPALLDLGSHSVASGSFATRAQGYTGTVKLGACTVTAAGSCLCPGSELCDTSVVGPLTCASSSTSFDPKVRERTLRSGDLVTRVKLHKRHEQQQEPRAGGGLAWWAGAGTMMYSIVAPVAILLFQFTSVYASTLLAQWLVTAVGRWLALVMSPVILLSLSMAMIVWAVVLKWGVVGRARAGCYAAVGGVTFHRDLFSTMFTQVARQSGVNGLAGTAAHSLWLRAMGAEVGKDAVVLATDGLSSFDLVHLGAGSVVDRDCVVDARRVVHVERGRGLPARSDESTNCCSLLEKVLLGRRATAGAGDSASLPFDYSVTGSVEEGRALPAHSEESTTCCVLFEKVQVGRRVTVGAGSIVAASASLPRACGVSPGTLIGPGLQQTDDVLLEGVPAVRMSRRAHSRNGADGEFEADLVGKREAPDLWADAYLPSEIAATIREMAWQASAGGVRLSTPVAESILLTGVTGFVGRYLLVDLLHAHPQSTVHCIVRALDDKDAMQRTLFGLKEAKLTLRESERARLMVYKGNITSPTLGLSKEVYQRLASTVTLVYHSAALISYSKSYAQLFAPNVLGTLHVLSFAATKSLKTLHMVSTIAALTPDMANEDGRIPADAPLGDMTAAPASGCTLGKQLGYYQSKWVAEKLVTQAGQEGLDVSVYRVPVVAGHTSTGFAPTRGDVFTSMIEQASKHGEVVAHAMNATPVDLVSQVIVRLSAQPRVASTGVGRRSSHTPPAPAVYNTACEAFNITPETLQLAVESAGGTRPRILSTEDFLASRNLLPALSYFLRPLVDDVPPLHEVYMPSPLAERCFQQILNAQEAGLSNSSWNGSTLVLTMMRAQQALHQRYLQVTNK